MLLNSGAPESEDSEAPSKKVNNLHPLRSKLRVCSEGVRSIGRSNTLTPRRGDFRIERDEQ